MLPETPPRSAFGPPGLTPAPHGGNRGARTRRRTPRLPRRDCPAPRPPRRSAERALCSPPRSLEVQIRLEPVQAAFTAEARLLVTAKRRRWVEAVVGVRPDHARSQPLGHGEDPGALLGPHARGETVRSVVRLLDGFVRRPESEHREHGAENLLLC